MTKKMKGSVQDLIGLERFSSFGTVTDKAEIVFFAVEPTNISVLSQESIDIQIHHLMMLLSMVSELEIIVLDSCECFDSNKLYLKKRLLTEDNENVRKLLMQDYDFLDEIQFEMSSARQFLFAIRFRHAKPEQIFNSVNRVAKAISEHGFDAKQLTKNDVKRMLGIYFGTSITGDEIDDIEGEKYFNKEGNSNEIIQKKEEKADR